MSILIDELLYTEKNMRLQARDGRWYIPKPIPYRSLKTYLKRIKDGVRVMVGLSFAVHYKTDE